VNGDAIITSLIFIALAGFILWLAWQCRLARRARSWPVTEAMIQSGAREVVTSEHGIDIILPVFAFTYKVAGEVYSGRFSLYPYITDPPADITSRLTDTKLSLHFNPRKPAQWFISTDLIAGCKVKQELGPHVMHLYPQ
jgi:hypothetical protein